MTEPRKCPEPGCHGHLVEEVAGAGWWRCDHCLWRGRLDATPEQHEIAALRARNAELEAENAHLRQVEHTKDVIEQRLLLQLDEAHKREVVLREALGDARGEFCYLFSEIRNLWSSQHSTDDQISAAFGVRPKCSCHLCGLLGLYATKAQEFQQRIWDDNTSESATGWLKAHDREVLEKAAERGQRWRSTTHDLHMDAFGLRTAILGEEEK